MRLCGPALENLTLISFDIGLKHIMKVEFFGSHYQIVGVIGSCIDKILCDIKKRKCKIIGEKYLGIKLPNGTYTGTLGLLQSGQGDLYLKGEPDTLINERFLDRSLPLRAENIWAGQIISDDKEFDYFDLLHNFEFPWQIYLGFFSTLFSFALVCFGLLTFNLKSNENYLNRNFLSKLVYISNYLKKSSQISIKSILLFFGLFLWFALLFATNTIKTNKVVVDTSALVKNRDELMKSDLVCFFEDDTAYNLAINSPRDGYLFKLFNEKTKLYDRHKDEKLILKSDKCIHKRKETSEYSLIRKNKVLIVTQVEANGALIIVSQLDITKKIWILKQDIEEYNVVIYFKKFFVIDDESRTMFKKFSTRLKHDHLEHGITKNMYNCMAESSESFYRKTIKVYKDISQYIDDHSGFSDLELNNFNLIFTFYFGILILIFVIFFLFEIAPFYLPISIELFYDYFY